LKLNGIHQPLPYADDINLLLDLDTYYKEKHNTCVDTGKEVSSEDNTEKIK
jgi:hypothetical protein